MHISMHCTAEEHQLNEPLESYSSSFLLYKLTKQLLSLCWLKQDQDVCFIAIKCDNVEINAKSHGTIKSKTNFEVIFSISKHDCNFFPLGFQTPYIYLFKCSFIILPFADSSSLLSGTSTVHCYQRPLYLPIYVLISLKGCLK